jgi:hypothetical protein
MAEIILKASEKVLVLGIREGLIYPAVVPNWLDVRIGLYISATQAVADDDPSALGETLTTTGVEQDRFWLGIKDSTNSMPRDAPFFGLSNSPNAEDANASVLETIDTATRWRVTHATAPVGLFLNDGSNLFADTTLQPVRVIQNPAGLSSHYATLVMLRMVRSIVGALVDHFYIAKSTAGGTDYGDSGVESATPTIDEIRNNFRSATWTEYFTGGHTFASVPDTVYAYWPFNNSRLRIHSIVVEKFA